MTGLGKGVYFYDQEKIMTNPFAITFDVDWAPDEVLRDLFTILSGYSFPVTLFATHKSGALDDVSRVYEIGLHPNFNPFFQNAFHLSSRALLEELKSWYPQAVGVRCHSRTVSAVLIDQFISIGLRYDANQICPYQKGLMPYTYRGFCRFTDFWQDDVHAIYQRPFILSNIPVESEGMKVFNFHPVHIYLNTESPERYGAAKAYGQEPHQLIELRNTQTKGTRDLLIELLDYLKHRRMQPHTLRDLACQWISAERPEAMASDD
jgi:hypothetical protein